VKRTELKDYHTTRSTAVAACKVAEGDEIIKVVQSDGKKDILIVTKQGLSIRFAETEVNSMGRVASGVRGIQLRDNDEIVAAEWVADDEGELLVISDIGYAKRTLLLDYPLQGRGGKGVQTFEFKEGKKVRSNGTTLIGAYYCKEEVLVTAISSDGVKHTATSEKAPIDERKSVGKLLFAVDKKDPIVFTFKLPQIEEQPKSEA